MLISKTFLLTIILFAIFLVKVRKDPAIGLYGFLYVLITRPWYNHPELGMFHFPQTIGIITLAVIFFKSRNDVSIKLRIDFQLKLMLLFFAWMILSLLINGSDPISNKWINEYYKTLILYFILINTLDSEERVVRFLWVWVGIYFYLSILGISKYSDGIHWNSRPFLWMHKNGWGPSVSIIIPMAVGLFWQPSLWRFSRKSDLFVIGCMVIFASTILWHHNKFVALTMIIGTIIALGSSNINIRKWFEKTVGGLSVLATIAAGLWGGSRAGFLATVASGTFSIILQLHSLKRTLISVAVVMVLLSYVGFDHMNNMYLSIKEHEDDRSAISRLVVWEATLDVVQENSIFGVGAGRFMEAQETQEVFESIGGVMNVHNSFLQLAVEMGLPGVILFLFMLLRACFLVFRISTSGFTPTQLEHKPLQDVKYLARYLPICILAWAVNLFFHNAAYGLSIYILIGTISAIENIIKSNASYNHQG